jgi:hypothetical protein
MVAFHLTNEMRGTVSFPGGLLQLLEHNVGLREVVLIDGTTYVSLYTNVDHINLQMFLLGCGEVW